MVLCNNNHVEIVHAIGKCPLCQLTEHNNLVHDFIESNGRGLVSELVAYLDSKNSEAVESAPTVRAKRPVQQPQPESVAPICDNSLCQNWTFQGCKRSVCQWDERNTFRRVR